jgi:hypothetical protein
MFVSDGATIDLEDLNGAAKTDDSLTSNNVGHKLLQVSTFESFLSSSLMTNQGDQIGRFFTYWATIRGSL